MSILHFQGIIALKGNFLFGKIQGYLMRLVYRMYCITAAAGLRGLPDWVEIIGEGPHGAVAGPLYLMNGKINQVLLTKAAARPLPQIILQDQMSTSKVIFHAISPYCII